MKNMKQHLKSMALGIALIIFSNPIGQCFLIVGNIIIGLGSTIKNFF